MALELSVESCGSCSTGLAMVRPDAVLGCRQPGERLGSATVADPSARVRMGQLAETGQLARVWGRWTVSPGSCGEGSCHVFEVSRVEAQR